MYVHCLALLTALSNLCMRLCIQSDGSHLSTILYFVYPSAIRRLEIIDKLNDKSRLLIMCERFVGSIWNSMYVHRLALLTALSNLCMRFCIYKEMLGI